MRTRTRTRAKLCSCQSGLQRSLQSYPELLESLTAGEKKASGKVGANIATVWQLAMRSLYASADVPVLGTREVIQNSVDAIREAIHRRKLKPGQGRIDVRWNAAFRTLEWEDNGIGMMEDVILNRFLVLGESGKRDASDSDVAAGGFGIAKAVILGTSSTFEWNMHTLDNQVTCLGFDQEIQITQADTFLQGTRITVLNVSPDYLYWWDSAGGGRRGIEDRLKELLSANDLPGIALRLDGEEVPPRFSRRGGNKIQVLGSWGPGTTAIVKAYKRPDRQGAYWIRLNGLFQFKHGSSGDLGLDVVIDLMTVVRPGMVRYPLNAARDALQGEARHTFRALVEQVERENLSTGNQQDDEVFDAEGLADNGLQADFDALSQLLADDPRLVGLFGAPGTSAQAAPAELEGELDVATSASGLGTGASGSVLKTNLPDDHVLDLSQSNGRIPWLPKGLQTPGAIRQALDIAETESPYEISQAAIQALELAESGELTVGQLRVIAEEMDKAARTVAQFNSRPIRVTPQSKVSKGQQNPFGHLGALRISKVNYPREKARAFRRSPRKWLPQLMLWSATLKLMAEAAGIARPLKPGFVLEDGTIGLTQRRSEYEPTVIYLHPDRLAEVVEANRHQPIAIAGFLHGVGAHELTHADGRMGDGHSEAYISARESLGARTAYLMPQLAQLAVKLLKLPDEADSLLAKVARLENQLNHAQQDREAISKNKRELERRLKRELSECRSELQALALTASQRTRATCTDGCHCSQPASGLAIMPDVVVVEPRTSDQEPPASLRAIQVVTAVYDVLMARPPEGIERGYLIQFFRRFHAHLSRIVDARLSEKGLL